jgi:hypothetical protein
VSELSEANFALGGAILLELEELAPGGANLRSPPPMLEHKELGGGGQMEGRMSIEGTEPLEIGGLEVEREPLSLRVSDLNEANFAPGGAILMPPTTLLEQEELGGKVQVEGGLSSKE